MHLARHTRRLLLLTLIAVLGSWVLSGQLASAPGNGRGDGQGGYAPYVPEELIIKFRPDTGPNERANLRAQFQATKRQQFRSGAEHWKLAPGRSVEHTIASLRGNPHVQYVEPNYLIEMDTTPNDARYGELWGMNNTGQTGGTPGRDIDAERAWGVSTGSRDVVVAVIDTGVDYNHPDLAANIWTNPGEIAGNGIDDDGNGFIDDIHGWDFYNNDNDPFDDNGHGSHCSGTIGGVGNNGIGVAGVNWNVSIMGVKFLSGGGSGSTSGAIASVDYATLMGVDVMSNSWGGGGFSQALLDAINDAAAADIVFVAAAGNNNTDNDVTPHYPSSYDAPNVIAVMATDANDVRSYWPSCACGSNIGHTSVDLAAPGTDILSTTPGNTYSVYSGTSMATPHVSGAAALLRAVAPNTSAVLVKQILMNMAEPVPALAGMSVTGARLNAFFPIAEPDDVPPGMIGDLAATGATSNSIFLAWTATGDDGTTGTAADYDLRYSMDPIDDANFAAATKVAGVAPPGPYGTPQSTEVPGLVAGTNYYFAIKAKDEWGNFGPISNIAMGMTLPPPTFASSPASFTADLLTGQTATRTLTLQNAGVGTLDWRIPIPSVGGPVTVLHEPLLLGKGEPDPRPGIPAPDGFGGPDIFGYRWMDSDEVGGPTFAWTDIAMTGTPIALTGDDSNAGPIPIGFNFPFYGTNFNSVRVSTNGWISFTSTATSYSNQPLPNSGAPENLIAAFWDDLNFGTTQRAVYENVGGNLVIQFTDVPPYSGTGAATFQIELRPGGEIRLRYLTMSTAVTSATVGIQNATKDDGLTIVYNDTYLHDNLEIRIAAMPQWLTASPTSGRLFAGQSVPVTVGIDASGLDGGTYEGSVNVETNDPLHPLVGHPVTLNVTGAPAISVTPLSLDFGQVYFGFSATLPVTINNTGTDALHVGSIVPADPQVSISPSSLTVPAHAGATVNVTYTPSSPSTLATTFAINSDASNAPVVTVNVAGYSLPAPSMLVSPTSFSETLYTGGQVNRSLRVRNSGGSNLNVTLTAQLGSVTQVPVPSPEPAKGDESDAGTGDNVIERVGGPDGFGYRYKDSDAPGGPTFSWVDISGIGTPIPFTGTEPDDTNYGPIPIGFNFTFYGQTFNSIRACSNGWISFTSTLTSLSNVNLPSGGTSAPNNLLAAFWDDLRFYTANGARAYTYYDGTRFIVQFKNVSKYGQASTSRMNFEFILYPSGKIVFQYLDMSGTLNSATIGIQDSTRTIGLSTSFNENYVHNNLAIEYQRVPDWLMVLPPTTATIPAGGYKDFTINFNAGDSGNRVFQGAVHIATNIPDPPFLDVPATLTVIGVADVATVPTSVDYGPRFVGYPHIRQLYVKNVGTADLTVFGVASNNPALYVEEPIAGAAQFTIPAGGQVQYNLRWLPTTAGPLNAAVTVTSDDPDEATLVVPVVGTALDPPILGYSPGSFSGSLYVGETSSSMLHLENTGGSDLVFNVGVRLTDATVVQDRSPEIPKGMEPAVHGAPVTAGAGGPDMFGYRWKDSDEPGGPAFDWFDISTIGTPIAGLDSDDEYSGAINLGFAFPFYGNTFSQIYAGTNGWLSFTAPTSSYLTNYTLPSTSGAANMLAPFWDDLNFGGVERARYYSDGTRFVIQYTAVPHYGTTSSFTFQIILYPSGKIVYQYLTLTGTPLDSNTVGIQNATKDDGLNIAYNQAYLHDNLAIEIQTIADWLTVDVSSGTIPAGGSMDIPVHFDATDLIGGLYSGGLRILSNDPASGLVEIPASLAVTGFPGIAAAPASLDFGTVFVGVSATLPVTISNPGSDLLHVTGVTISGDYSTDTTPFDLAPRGTRVLNVVFAPSVDGTRTGSIELVSNATGMPLLSVPLTGNGLYPPVAELDPETVAEVAMNALPPAGMKTETVRLCNTGGSDLEWSAGVTLEAPGGVPPEPIVQAAVDLPKGDTSADGTGWHIERNGGPDTFGYRYRDSDEAGGPVYDWSDISSIGTPVAGLDSDDEYVGPLTLPFNFPYYGNTFNQIWLSTNGWMSFTLPTSSSLTNYAMPSTSGQANQIAPFWDDLDFEGVPKATTYYDGSRFIIQYTNVEHYPGGAGTTSYTFQVILYPSGRVVYQYQSMSGTLNSHTIGIQDSTKTVGLGVTYNEDPPYVHDGLAIEFFTIPEWLTIDPTSGVIPAGGCADVTVMLNAAGLEDGDYDGLITFATNDPFHGILDVPVRLHVGQVALTYVNVDPNTLNLSSNGNTIKAVIQLPPEYDPHDIDIATVSIYGQVFANPTPIAFTDENHDGIMELVVKFDRAAFEALVPEGGSVQVTITGEVHDQTWFIGSDTIRAIRPRMMAPNGGEYLIGGQPATFTWLPPAGMADVAYDLILSRDGGMTWESLASGLNVTSFSWIVSGPSTGSALVRVFASDNQGVMGYDTSDGAFSIAASLLAPNPATDLVVTADATDLILQWKRPDPDLTHGPVAWYRIYQAASPQGPFEEVAEVTTESLRDPHVNHEGVRVLYFKVVAGNGAGPSAD